MATLMELVEESISPVRFISSVKAKNHPNLIINDEQVSKKSHNLIESFAEKLYKNGYRRFFLDIPFRFAKFISNPKKLSTNLIIPYLRQQASESNSVIEEFSSLIKTYIKYGFKIDLFSSGEISEHIKQEGNRKCLSLFLDGIPSIFYIGNSHATYKKGSISYDLKAVAKTLLIYQANHKLSNRIFSETCNMRFIHELANPDFYKSLPKSEWYKSLVFNMDTKLAKDYFGSFNGSSINNLVDVLLVHSNPEMHNSYEKV